METIEGLDRSVDIEAINRQDRQVLLSDGRILSMATLHLADGKETDDIDEAAFATVKLSEDKWTFAILADYDEPRMLN